MKLKVLVLTACAGALMAGGAIAGEKKKMSEAEYKAKAEAKLEKKFAKMDANGDGEVTQAEFTAYQSEKAAKYWAEWSDGDDAVSLEEAKEKMYAEMKEKKKKKKEKKERS